MARVAPQKPSSPPSSKPEKAPKTAGTSKLHPSQSFTPARVHRRELKGAEYNPRVITDDAAAKLKKALKKYGLVEALVWNKRTGNIVGGHQRLDALDALDAHGKGTGDYELDVNVVDVSEKRERELNILLNNQSIQGAYDPMKLGEMFRLDVKPEDVGFDTYDLEEMFSGTEYEDLYEPPADPGDADETADKINAIGVIKAPVAADEDAPNGRMENGEAIRDPEAHAKLIEERNAMRTRIANDPLRETDFYLMVVCGTAEEALDLGAHLGAKDRYIDGRALYQRLGIEPPDTEEA